MHLQQRLSADIAHSAKCVCDSNYLTVWYFKNAKSEHLHQTANRLTFKVTISRNTKTIPHSFSTSGHYRNVDPTILSVDLLELLSLSSLTDWISVSSCVASGATIAKILLSTSLGDSFRSSNWDCTLSWVSLRDSAEMCESPLSTNCWVGVLFSSDNDSFLIDGDKGFV